MLSLKIKFFSVCVYIWTFETERSGILQKYLPPSFFYSKELICELKNSQEFKELFPKISFSRNWRDPLSNL